MPADSHSDAPAHLECRGIRKTFGSTVALDGVSLAVRAGSVHALVGENGAGKSTLGKIMAGVIAPDEGELVLRGAPVSFASPRQALDRGIAIVAQELALVPLLTVAQNVFLGNEPRRFGIIDRGALAHQFRELAAATGFDLAADTLVGSLPMAQQQQVEILRALARDAELIVLDEPTAALSGPEAARLHEIVRMLAAKGTTVVLVSHFLREVLDLADTITILRDGRIIRTGTAAAETESSLVAGMLGRPIGQAFPEKRASPDDAPVVLRVSDIVGRGVRGVSLELRAGEILGLAGLIGAGRTEIARAIYGADPIASGRVEAGGATWTRPAGALRNGVVMIPESRAADGLMLGRPVRENASLASITRLSRGGLVMRGDERTEVTAVLGRSDVGGGIERPAGTLSGGNQQKLMFGRAMMCRPAVLIADEPTRGVDVGAKRAIYELIAAMAAEGTGVLLISSEIEEILGLAHRILVIREGGVTAELTGERMTEAAILQAAFGASEVA